MTTPESWITRLKKHTGYDVANDGLVWPKDKLLSDQSSIHDATLTAQDVLRQVLATMYPYLKTQWDSEPDTRPQWLSFLDALGSEAMKAKRLVSNDVYLMLFECSVVTGIASMPRFERSLLPMIWEDPVLLDKGDLNPTWMELAARMATWISPEGRSYLTDIARTNEMNASFAVRGIWHLREAQISLGSPNPAWSPIELQKNVLSWLGHLRDDILSRYSPMAMPVAFSGSAAPLISATWGEQFFFSGVPAHSKEMSQTDRELYRLNVIIDTWSHTSWDIYDAHTWQWFTSIGVLDGGSKEERKFLMDAMHERFPELSALYRKLSPIVEGLADDISLDAQLYVQLIRGARPLIPVQVALEIPSLD